MERGRVYDDEVEKERIRLTGSVGGRYMIGVDLDVDVGSMFRRTRPSIGLVR